MFVPGSTNGRLARDGHKVDRWRWEMQLKGVMKTPADRDRRAMHQIVEHDSTRERPTSKPAGGSPSPLTA